MCILFLALNQHPDYPLVIAANRDEFFARPTASSGFWADTPSVLAGRDLQAGGTWMGLNTGGRIAALTNIRAPQSVVADRQSRGKLVTDYLRQVPHAESSKTYQAWLARHKQDFNGYNLVFGHYTKEQGVRLHVYNNHQNRHEALKDGIYGLSNADIDSPWPKTTRGINALAEALTDEAPDDERLFTLLKDTQQADDALLPDTGIPRDWEKRLSAIFVEGEDYGTRSSTLLFIDNKGGFRWAERTFDQQGQAVKTLEIHSHFQGC
ncbi:NRDE family protein [Lacimicrobium sp. SS2-24]|uniref:NRDE family protein n=1 Tax=Lacimicrobium sp. SS2-24 TaxID=2005569 RepID=UPI000B4B5E3C|nr:NRDE family protein [Lacimicrobium sp. SS2-24]